MFLTPVKDEIVKLLTRGDCTYVVHGNADLDALASAYALASVFSGSIIAPGGLDRLSKALVDELDISFKEDITSEETSRIVILDTSGPEQLGGLRYLGDDRDVIVIDHHTKNSSWASRNYYCDESRSSCCEIVYEIVKITGARLPRKAALAMLAGMLTDSGHFKYGNANTLATFSEIMSDYDISMHDALSIVEGKSDLSERISQLKGMQRLRYTRIDRYIIATSYGSAFEASVCRALITLGADVAFVASQRGDQFRISSRAGQDIVDLGLHLGKLLEGIGNETANGGGGHSAAAGLSGRGDARDMLDLCLHRTRKAIRSQINAARQLPQSGER